MDMQRIIITAHDGTAAGELDPTRVVSLVAKSEVNGENAMEVTTTQELAKGDRLLWRDGRGYWHEYVVEGAESVHDMHDATLHTYWCPWSIQHDLECTFVTGMPGTGGTPATARQALTAALAGTARWVVGTVNVTTTGKASFWRLSGWEAIQTLVETWGGEIRATITVAIDGTVTRKADLLKHVGATTATRRFDYGADVSGINRKLEDQLWTARVMPLGAGEETASGGYGRKITIESVNSGVAWLENAEAVPLTRVPNGSGGWEVPLQVVENGDMKTPAALKSWATEHLSEWTTPKVSYEADVVQLARAGMDALGVSLGDEIAVVDTTFGSTPLRIQGRALAIEEDLLDPTATVLTVSNLRGSLASTLQSLARATAEVHNMVTDMSANQSAVEWVSDLIKRINDEANATGGYTYITEGQGTRTYDVAVSDPLVGAEASMVVEVKGGNIRIANTKDSSGNWEWKTMLQSGYVNSEVIRAMGEGSGGIAEVTSTGFYSYIAQTLYMALTADGMRYYDGTGTTENDVIALFSAALMRMGYENGSNVEVTQSGITFNNYKGLPVGIIDTSAHVDYVEKNKTIASTALVWTGPVSGKYTARLPLSPLAAFYDDPTPMYDRYIQGMFEGTVGSSDHEQGKFDLYAYDTTVTSTWTSLGTVVNPNITVKAQTIDARNWELVFTTTTNPTKLRSLTLSVGWFYEQYAPTFVFGTGEATGAYALAQGSGTIANGSNQLVAGKYNVKDTSNKYALIVGNGTSNSSRSNAFTVDWQGNVSARGVALFYVSGNTIRGSVRAGGYVTNAAKDVRWTIPLSKPIIGSSSVTCTAMSMTVRMAGAYLIGSSSGDDDITPSLVTCSISPSGINCQYRANSAISGATNNSECAVQCTYVLTVG